MVKIIHYCWFGGKEKPKLVEKCIASWRKFCPEFEIKEWNESNFDIHCCKYVEEAYNQKKWAFVSDYCRFYVLYNYGGIYLDTDVELIKSLEGLPDTFVGFEDDEYVASGLIRGANKGDEICNLMLDKYNQDNFSLNKINSFGDTVVKRETVLLQQFGLRFSKEIQLVKGTTVFTKEYFNPKDIEGKIIITDKTIAIHYGMATWFSYKMKFKQKSIVLLYKIVGKKIFDKLKKLFGHKK